MIRACIICGTPTTGGPRCDQHPANRSGRTMPPDWKTTRARIVKRDHGVCHYCGTLDATSADHIIPVSLGGTDTDDNLVCCCITCNQSKNNRIWS